MRLNKTSLQKNNTPLFQVNPLAKKYFILLGIIVAAGLVLSFFSRVSALLGLISACFSLLIFTLLVFGTLAVLVKFLVFFFSTIGTQNLNKSQITYILKSIIPVIVNAVSLLILLIGGAVGPISFETLLSNFFLLEFALLSAFVSSVILIRGPGKKIPIALSDKSSTELLTGVASTSVLGSGEYGTVYKGLVGLLKELKTRNLGRNYRCY